MAKLKSDVTPLIKNQVTEIRKQLGITEAQFVRDAVKEKLAKPVRT